MSSKAHVVVVDDEPDLRDTVREYLELHGLKVSVAGGGTALRQVMDRAEVDLVVLDINMPGEDGLTIARYLREHSNVAIVMLTAATDVVDRIVGLETGADDYLPKPVDLRELLARIRAVLRRTGPGAASAAPQAKSAHFGDFKLDLEAHKLFDAEGGEVAITSMEYNLLKTFADHPNRVLNRDQLLEMAHDREWDPFDRSIDIRISRLRKKLEQDPTKPQIIKTVRGVGYIYSPNA